MTDDPTPGTRMKKKLAADTARDADAWAQMPVGPVNIDSDGRYVTVGRVLAQLRCRCGQHLGQVILPADDDRPVVVKRRVGAGSKVWAATSNVLDDDTRHHPFECCGTRSTISERDMVAEAVAAVAGGETATINFPRHRLR